MVTSLLELTKNLLIGGLNLIDALGLPTDLIFAFADYTGYGVWFVGADLCLKIAASIVFWIGLKLSVGLALFVWRLVK